MLKQQNLCLSCCCCSVPQSCLILCEPMDCSKPGFPVLHYLPGVCSNSCPLSQWCHPTISSSVTPFSSCPQSFPASGSFPVSWLSASGGQLLELQYQSFQWIFRVDFFLGLTGLIIMLFKGLSRVFTSITIQKHQFLGTQPSLWPNSHICTWLLEKP